MILYAAFLETIDKEKDAEILPAHLEYLYRLIDEGKVFAKGPFTDHSGGLIIYKASSYEEAMEWASKDPVVSENTRKLTMKEWKSNVEA
jgi:uncharacterized protein